MNAQLRPLFEAATRPYVGAGTFAWRFARGKLRHDPVFFFLLRRGLLPDRESLLDLGLRPGILLSLLKAAKEQYRRACGRGTGPRPVEPRLRGIEVSEPRVRVARRALGGLQVVQGDLRDLRLQPCSVIVMFDVLHYLDSEEQQRLIEKAAGGARARRAVVVARSRCGAGFTFHLTRWGSGSLAYCAASSGGTCTTAARFNGSPSWRTGLSVRVEPMSEGTPFANFLFVQKGLASMHSAIRLRMGLIRKSRMTAEALL